MKLQTLSPMLVAAALSAPTPLSGQELPAVSIIDAEPRVVGSFARAYHFEASRQEVLYCVQSWTSTVDTGVERIVITATRHASNGTRHAVPETRSQCRDGDGKALPTIHTHTDGNCQFSPRDLVAAVGRQAPFEGIQCGEHHFVWLTTWQIAAFAHLIGQPVHTAATKSP